jgi:hypothetical protein
VLEVQRLLRSGKTLADLTAEYGVRVTTHESEPLVILNYSQIDSPKRDPVVQECRGLTLEVGTWDVKARSFFRFFNAGECPDLEQKFDFENFTAQAKEDGSLMLLYCYQGSWRVNTRGSFAQGEICPGAGKTWEEAFFEVASRKELNHLRGKFRLEDWTLVFEFCSPWNKVVRRYDKPTLFLLAAFHNESGVEVEQGMVDLCAAGLGVRQPDRFNLMGLDHAVRWANEVADDPTFEGFVLRDKNGMRLKVKNARYVALHRLKDNGNVFLEKNLVPLVLENEQEEVLVHFPEAADKVFEVTEKLAGARARMNAVWECAKKFPTQKDFALFVNKHTPLSGVLFSARKTGRDPNVIFQESADSLVKKLF